ncbi:MAG TPA: MlaD family protein [Terriglobia bacterium]|nr:MlaD family protein [Terriglobia bacterium]
MPQRKEIQWAQLRVGIMVAISLIVFAVAIFLISGQIGFITRKYTLHALFPTAEGLRPGSEVDLAGIPAGTVKAIRISAYHDPKRSVEIDLQIMRKYHDQVRADSIANQTTAGLLGDAFVDITRGDPTQPVIPDDGVIKSNQQADIKQVEANANDVVTNLNQLSQKLTDMTNQITTGQGSIGKLLYDETFYNRLNQSLASAQKLVDNVRAGQGTIGKFMVDPAVYNKTEATLDRLNQLLDQVQNGQGTLPKLINDPGLYNQLKDVTAKANTLIDNVNKGQGTLGQLVTDKQLYDRLNSTIGHLDAITGRMQEGTGTLGKLSTDPSLFNNLRDSSQSLKEFLVEFRKNPRKYLQVRIHLF